MPLLRMFVMSSPKNTFTLSPRTTDVAAICFVIWSSATTRPVVASASRQAAPAVIARLPRDGVHDERPHDAEDDDRHDRAEVDRAGPDPQHRDEAPEQVQIRVRDLADEVQDRVEPGGVGDAREPAHQHPDEDQDDVDEEERVDVPGDGVARGREDGHERPLATTASTASENAART